MINTKPYGSISSTKYRVCSLFNFDGGTPAQAVKVYAATGGNCFIQKVDGTNKINLILKPDKQPNINYSPIKYLVYRGLKESSFLASGGTQVLDASTATSNLLQHMWEKKNHYDQKKLAAYSECITNGLVMGDFGLAVPGGQELDEKMTLDAVFDTYLFQEIEAGWSLGEFDTSGDFGFQIILDGPNFLRETSDPDLEKISKPCLKDVRSLDHVIEIDYEASQNKFADDMEEDIKTRLKREQILSYLDPVAYFALLHSNKLVLHQTSGENNAPDIYNDVLSSFATNDTIYIDLRNELNNSLNFYGNYGDGTAQNFAQIKLGISDVIQTKAYHTDGWPVLTLKSSDFASGTSGDTLSMSFSFPEGDNSDTTRFAAPLVHLSGASLFEEFPGRKEIFKILPITSGYTEAVQIGIPAKEGMPWPFAIRLNYCKRYNYELAASFTEPSPLLTIYKDDLIDNLLSPKDVDLILPEGVQPKDLPVMSSSHNDLKYIGWTSKSGVDFLMRNCVARDSIGEVAFAFRQGPAEVDGKSSNITVMSQLGLDYGEDSDSGSFFIMLQNDRKLVRLYTIEIQASGTKKCTQVDSVHDNLSVDKLNKSADDLIFFAYTHDQKAIIEGLEGSFLQNSPQYYVAMNHVLEADTNGIVHYSLELGIQGIVFNNANYSYNIGNITTGIQFYSLDGRNYFTNEYATDLEVKLEELIIA